ncbi:MAG: rod shape-determining protein MreC [Bacteroidia bacterium]|nr:MAG: rod shape-determining protein MreC [Bacteroidia bacterium]
MRNLFKFIIRYYFFFLFLLLETLAIVLTLSNQYYHQTFFLNSANRVSSGIYQTYNKIGSYFHLRTIHDHLLEENVRLLSKKKENFIITDGNVFIAEDTLFQRRFSYVHARVINNSVNRRNNYLTLNKGRMHGIKPDMGVIHTSGVVGIVIQASERFSVVMSLLHSDMMISTKISHNNHIGSLVWEGKDYRKAHMLYIPPHVELLKGDTIVTSGFSTVFPENIIIGTIDDWEIRRGENFYTAIINLALDYNNLTHVYVVQNLLKGEQEGLEEAILPDI